MLEKIRIKSCQLAVALVAMSASLSASAITGEIRGYFDYRVLGLSENGVDMCPKSGYSGVNNTSNPTIAFVSAPSGKPYVEYGGTNRARVYCPQIVTDTYLQSGAVVTSPGVQQYVFDCPRGDGGHRQGSSISRYISLPKGLVDFQAGILIAWPYFNGVKVESPSPTAQYDFARCECLAEGSIYSEKYQRCFIKNTKFPPIVLGFFNGVWNTEKQAEDGLNALKSVVGSTHGDRPIRYEKFYNQTGRSTGNTEAQDIAETFIQRSTELDGVLADRWEHYWEMLSGRHRLAGSFTERLVSGLHDGGEAFSQLIDSIASSMLAGFVKGLASLLSNPPTAVDMADHLSRLQAIADEGSDFVLVAHSQGNLFVNLAYDGLKKSHPATLQAVVHVAPASPTVRGMHVLSDLDAVINGLRNFGSWTVQAINLWLPFNKADASGHTLVGTYLNGQTPASTTPNGPPDTTPRAHVKGLIVNALNQVLAP
ncbi:hypothetical protein [Variovorax paradoxus]|uniref:hypothetical protein n=1 Tax=Variovorax paradoxus TaxID=34073 RepID=UPI001AE5CE6A|nr:hypothetical protein [Variovorax paradoxus]MDR6456640.1 hypothetical protein [Variovorax paradoxus]